MGLAPVVRVAAVRGKERARVVALAVATGSMAFGILASRAVSEAWEAVKMALQMTV